MKLYVFFTALLALLAAVIWAETTVNVDPVRILSTRQDEAKDGNSTDTTDDDDDDDGGDKTATKTDDDDDDDDDDGDDDDEKKVKTVAVPLGDKHHKGKHHYGKGHFGKGFPFRHRGHHYRHRHHHHRCRHFVPCYKLPRQHPVPDINNLVVQTPLQFIYTFKGKYNCSFVSFARPDSTSTCFNGTSNVKPIGDVRLNVFQFLNGDGDQYLKALDSDTNEFRDWYFWRYICDSNGCFMCAYTCEGKDFNNFVCVSTSDAFAKIIRIIVRRARRWVRNGRYIRRANANCTIVDQCPSN